MGFGHPHFPTHRIFLMFSHSDQHSVTLRHPQSFPREWKERAMRDCDRSTIGRFRVEKKLNNAFAFIHFCVGIEYSTLAKKSSSGGSLI
jgi:hypothetical protein